MNSPTAARKFSESTEKPNSLGSWETITVRAIPARYPTRTGIESSSVTNPNRARPPASMIAPTTRASSPASATRWSGSAPASGMIAAATSGQTAESGLMIRMRLGPSRK